MRKGFDPIEYIQQCFVADEDNCMVIPQRSLGFLSACFANGEMVEMWFNSPDGDSSDVQIFTMRCRDNEQALAVCANHKKVWGI
jgi:hypothetical protein